MNRRTSAILAVGLEIGAYIVVQRPQWLRWGATAEEVGQPLPGDDLIPQARYVTTRAITITASAMDIWPWLVPMGYGRAGWYSYDRLEAAVSAGEFMEDGSADRIIPALQGLQVGDSVPLSPAGGLRVAVLDSGRALVLHYRMDPFTAGPARNQDRYLDWSWAFVLARLDDQTSRLLIRTRAAYRPRVLAPAVYLVLEPAHFVMERKMLLGIRERASRDRSADGD